ncbi:hypothetical protein BOO71_0004516 [Deinococcus marmoris]|uniref:2-dehydropantoate 2-reductase n=1 Tax=Deinococcus marmoris TaxID=249408 RepID=A0A1U7P148_9DEIO|nr:hypothetical protein BOO71_0004516 [Deinococcus marmoris]
MQDLPLNHTYDLIVVSVQHYRFAEVMAFLNGRVGDATVLLFNNLWTDPQAAVSALPAKQLVWGFPRAGGGFRPDGVLAGGLLKNVMIGQFGPRAKASSEHAPTRREQAVRELFRSSGFGIQRQYDFQGWLWFHFLINAALLPQAYRAGSFAKLMASDAHLREGVLNVRELVPLLAARGVDVKQHLADVGVFSLPLPVAARILNLAPRLIAPAQAVIETALVGEGDLEREVRPIALDVLAEAQRLGVAVPRLEAFVAQLDSVENAGGML